jgi:two-component system chemotaxis response regulator CheY
MTLTILIVEDTDLCRDSLEVALMGIPGTRVRSVATAEQALGRLEEEAVCTLITDLHLTSPKPVVAINGLPMDGFDLIAHVRSLPRYARLPVLVTSGDTNPATAARLECLGISGYFPKPYSPGAVRKRLAELINERIDSASQTHSPGGLPSASTDTLSTVSPSSPERDAS